MRDECPVLHSDEHGGFWAVTRYKDVWSVAHDWRTYSSEFGTSFPINAREPGSGLIPNEYDPPFQRAVRKLLDPCFSPKVVATWEDRVRAIANELIDKFIDSGRCELHSEFAGPLPGQVFLELGLGQSMDDWPQLSEWIDTMIGSTDPVAAKNAMTRITGWIRQVLDGRKSGHHRGDVIDAVLTGEVDARRLTEDEQVRTILTVVLGGLETVTSAIGSAAIYLAQDAELRDKLADRDALTAAIEEFLRLQPPATCFSRQATVDTEIGGQAIAAGERILIYWASANRDQREFDRPDEIVLDRTSNRHLSFSMGPHRCLGSHVARLEIRVCIEQILDRMKDLTLDTDEAAYRYLGGSLRGPASVPLRFTPRPGALP